MGGEYYIVPKPGYSVEDLKMKGINADNAMIVKIGPVGVIEEEHLYTPSNVSRWNARLHPSISRRLNVYDIGSRIISVPAPPFEGFISDGLNPFIQIIHEFVSSRGKVTEDEIVKYIIDKKYKPNKKTCIKWIRGIIKYMRNQGYLNLKSGFIFVGERELPIGNNKYPIEEGYDPILKELENFIRRKGEASKGEISDFIIGEMGWIHYDPVLDMTASEVLELHLKSLIKKGVIEYDGKKYKFVKPLDKY